MTDKPNDLAIEIRGEDDFASRVEGASFEHVVIVDFWAEWCAPCKVLGPVLEKVVGDFEGKALLAKVNVDQNQALAARWQIRGIPAVKVFRNGGVVKELVGVLPEAELRRELSELIPSEADDLVTEGEAMEKKGKAEDAAARYHQAAALRPGHPAAMVGLARIAYGNGDIDAARELAESVHASSREREEVEGILALIEFSERCEKAGGRKAIDEGLARDPDNLDLIFSLACCLARERDYQSTLDELLNVIEKEKHYRDDAAKKAMVSIFGIIGQRSELADDYRERLARLLYS